MSSLLVEHAAELAQDGVGTRLEVTLTRRPAAEPTPRCLACRRAPAALDVVAELVAVDPANQPAEGTLGRVETALCRGCVGHLAPALPPALAAAGSTPDGWMDGSAAAALLRWLGASSRQIAAAHVHLADDATTTGGDPR